MQYFAIASGYSLFALFSYHAYSTKSLKWGYAASAVGMLVYYWQIQVFRFTEQQWFTLPTSVYFMGLAYTRKLHNDLSNQKILDSVGIFILIFFTVSQALGLEGTKYSLLLGVEGIILISLGITRQYNIYKFAGIAALSLAVLSQTYVYILNIPRWLITGLVGLVFLVFAIYLLLHRKENK